MKTSSLLIPALAIGLAVSAQAQDVTFKASTTGEWNVGSNYVGGTAPTTGQSVGLRNGSVIQFTTGSATLGNFFLDNDFGVHTVHVNGGTVTTGNFFTDSEKRFELIVDSGSATFGFMGIGGQANIQLYAFNLANTALLQFGNIAWVAASGGKPGTSVELTLDAAATHTPITTNDWANLVNFVSLDIYGGSTGWTVGQKVKLVDVTGNSVNWTDGYTGAFADNAGVTFDISRVDSNTELELTILAVPEPTTLGLLALGAAALIRRRRA